MQRLPILVVSPDPSFLADPRTMLERRGCEHHVAAGLADVRRLLAAHVFGLGVVNATSARLTPESLRGLHGALRRQVPAAMIAVVRPEDAPALQALGLPDLHVVAPPLTPHQLLGLSAHLVGIGRRRDAHGVVQIHAEVDGQRTTRMGTLRNIGRHGLLVRFERELPAQSVEGVASFMLPGSREAFDLRVEMKRGPSQRGVHDYGFAFTEITREAYAAIADFVDRA